MATKLEGGGGLALVARPLVEELFFCGFPNAPTNLTKVDKSYSGQTLQGFRQQVDNNNKKLKTIDLFTSISVRISY